MSTLTTATIYWDTQDPTNEGWAYRVRYSDGHEESGEWDAMINERDGGVADAVIDLVAQHGGPEIDSGSVSIEGLCGSWTQ